MHYLVILMYAYNTSCIYLSFVKTLLPELTQRELIGVPGDDTLPFSFSFNPSWSDVKVVASSLYEHTLRFVCEVVSFGYDV